MYKFSLQEYLGDLEKVVNIDSGNFYAPGTNAVADFFVEKFRALGLSVEKKYKDGFEAAPFVTVRNSDSDRIDVLFLAHMDSVFPEGTAEKRPFRIDESGHVRGPGCVDCKGGCVAVYHLIRELVENNECRFNFCVALNSDEERGSKYSREFIEELADKSDRCLVMEPGRPLQEYVDTRKSGANYTLKCHGIAAHSGVEPEKGASAILELSRLVPEIYKYFNLEEGTTVNIGRFTGGSDNGQVPDYAEFTLSLRCLHPERSEVIDAEIREMMKHPTDSRCTLELECRSFRPAMFPHEKTKEMLEIFSAIGDEMNYPVTYLTTGGGSDGNWVAHRGVATLDGCGPAGGCLHTEDEYLIKETVGTRIEILRRLLTKLY